MFSYAAFGPNVGIAKAQEIAATGDDSDTESYVSSPAHDVGADNPPGNLGRLGEYELLAKLGQGGMGAVYKARQTRLDKIVALKVLPKHRTGDPQAIARFEREMKAIGGLTHANIVQAFDARDIEGTTVLVMEYVEGLDLSQLIRRQGRLPIADACELVRQTAVGLQYAHEHGLVHRDIKPSNLMLSVLPSPSGRGAGGEGIVKILDLGLALLAGEASNRGELTSTGEAVGSADYIAPEQATDSHNVDIRVDIYSLGCTLYKLLTGHAPFSGPQHQSALRKMLAHAQTPPPEADSLRPDIPAELVAVLKRMMAKDPADRFQVPAEVAAAVAPFCAGANLGGLFAQNDKARPSGPNIAGAPPTPRGRSRDLRWLISRRVLVAAALGLAILATVAVSWNRMHAPQSPEAKDLERAPQTANIEPPKPVAQPPEVTVRQSILFVRRNGNDDNIEKLTLTDRHDENELALRPWAPRMISSSAPSSIVPRTGAWSGSIPRARPRSRPARSCRRRSLNIRRAISWSTSIRTTRWGRTCSCCWRAIGPSATLRATWNTAWRASGRRRRSRSTRPRR